MRKKVLAIDPGVTTGMACRLSDGTAITFHLPGPDSTAVFNALESLRPLELVVLETFFAARIDPSGLYTVRLIGSIEALCWQWQVPLDMHPPFKRKAFLTRAMNDIKARNGGIQPVIHEADALSHLYAYEEGPSMIKLRR